MHPGDERASHSRGFALPHVHPFDFLTPAPWAACAWHAVPMQPMGQAGMTYLEIPMKDFDFAALGRRYQALPMTPRHWLVLLLSGSTLAAVAQTSAHTPAAPTAQAPQAQAETVVTQKEEQVTATRQTEGAYTPTTVTVGGKTPMTLRETPQSVTVLTQQRLEDQALTDTTNALSWIPGLGNTLANESDTANITARGFNADNVTIDGSLAGASFWQLPADLSMYEQIEVLRGLHRVQHRRHGRAARAQADFGRKTLELLPADWPAVNARNLSVNIYKRIFEQADEYFLSIAKTAEGSLPAINSSFYKRFGGLELAAAS